jgi:archaemetzincin
MKYFLLIIIILFAVSCGDTSKNKKPVSITTADKQNIVKIKLLPLGKTTLQFIANIFSELKQVIGNIELLPHEEMPRNSYYAPRKRYRADSLIHWMSKRANTNEVFVGITMNDISTTKGDKADYGVMGLGFMPGKACVASSYRLKDKKNFFKVAIHELGHTTGLPHCPDKTCYMRDAEGGDHTSLEKGFCNSCKNHLVGFGWRL